MASKDIVRVQPEYIWYPHPTRPELERCFISLPGFVDPGPRDGTWCGVHGMELCWVVRGPNGAIEWSVSTDWIPGRVGDKYRREHGEGRGHPDFYPRGMPISYHASSFQPALSWTDEGDYSPTRTDCLLLGEEPTACWAGQQSYSGGNDLLVDYVKRGDGAVWEKLDEAYDNLEDSGINAKTWRQHRKNFLQKQADDFEVN